MVTASLPEVILSNTQYIVPVVFPATVEALDLIVTFVPGMSVTLLFPSVEIAKFITSPAYGDEILAIISAALGSANVCAVVLVSKRNNVYWSNCAPVILRLAFPAL